MKPTKFIPLAQETREVLGTNEAAPHLGVQPDGMRQWAFKGTGPIQPLRYQRRLMWRVSDIRRIVAGE